MTVYLKHFLLPSDDAEYALFTSPTAQMTCYETCYPYGLFKGRVPRLDFAPITILYGGNGSGKTTILNAIARKLNLAGISEERERLPFFDTYASDCSAILNQEESIPEESRLIASDDVFRFIFQTRAANRTIEKKRKISIADYWDKKNSRFQVQTLSDVEHLQEYADAHHKTVSRFVRHRVESNRKERSNGENAFRYFVEAIQENGLYLLDEPENSLSAGHQLNLLSYLENSVRLGVQLIIATHSPLLLSLREARIYDLDDTPVRIKPWQDLENVRIFYDFFQSKASFFQTRSDSDTKKRESHKIPSTAEPPEPKHRKRKNKREENEFQLPLF